MDLNFDFTEKRIIITSFFCVAFIIANLITVKIIDVNFLGMQTPAGVLIYPLIYILTNVITNVYGENWNCGYCGCCNNDIQSLDY